MKTVHALIYFGLLCVAVPWFWPADNAVLLFGLPLWVCGAVLVSALVSLLTLVILLAPWPHEERAEDE